MFSSGGVIGEMEWNETATANIISYDSTDDSWKDVGRMTVPRSYFAVGIIPHVDKICPGSR